MEGYNDNDFIVTKDIEDLYVENNGFHSDMYMSEQRLGEETSFNDEFLDYKKAQEMKAGNPVITYTSLTGTSSQNQYQTAKNIEGRIIELPLRFTTFPNPYELNLGSHGQSFSQDVSVTVTIV